MQVLLLSRLRVIVLAGDLLFGRPLLEFAVDLVTVELVLFFLGHFLFQELISAKFAQGHVLHVVSLFENLTSKILLLYLVRVLRANSIAEAALGGLVLPVSLRCESNFLYVAVDLNRSLFNVATSKD